MADLERILQQLHDSEINAGVQTFYDTGMQVWRGHESNGIHGGATVAPVPTTTHQRFSSGPAIKV
jgi:hypothetical protein